MKEKTPNTAVRLTYQQPHTLHMSIHTDVMMAASKDSVIQSNQNMISIDRQGSTNTDIVSGGTVSGDAFSAGDWD